MSEHESAEKSIAEITALMHDEAKRRRTAAGASALAIAALLAFFSLRSRVSMLVLSVSAAAVSVFFATAALRMRRMMPAVLALGALITLVFSALGDAHGVHANVGVHCASVELMFVAVTALPLLMAMRKNGDPIDHWRVAAWTALGGAIGAVCLSVACGASGALEHSLVFHAGAVAAALVITRVMVKT